MISICIPVYNYYAYPLVRRLSNQIKQMNDGEFEIICIDDHSSGYYVTQNKGISEIATFLRLGQNIGRSRIRNLFLKYAKGEYMVFLDCDMVVPDNFVKVYLREAKRGVSVAVGGVTYDERGNDTEHKLRYMYGTKVESRPVEERRKHPYRSFMTGNFMIKREILEKIRFDESITKYGHEDTLFGYSLEQAKVPITHIDNAAINGQVETNVEFLHKTVEAVENLAEIYDRMWEDQRFCQSVRLLRVYGRLRRMGLHKVVYNLFRMLKNPMESHFVSGNGISITQFNFYKLGILIKKLHNM